jgi:hypothetical protein
MTKLNVGLANMPDSMDAYAAHDAQNMGIAECTAGREKANLHERLSVRSRYYGDFAGRGDRQAPTKAGNSPRFP